MIRRSGGKASVRYAQELHAERQLPDWAHDAVSAEFAREGREGDLYRRLEVAARKSVKQLLRCPQCGHVKGD